MSKPVQLPINNRCSTCSTRLGLAFVLNESEDMIHTTISDMAARCLSYLNSFPKSTAMTVKDVAPPFTESVLVAHTSTKAAEDLTDIVIDGN